MKHIVYKTTNTINGKYYIGKHSQESNEFDGYLGSGLHLKRAITKYGKDKFIRETLGEYDSDTQAYLAEITIMGDDWETDPLCYNMSAGGYGLGKGFKMSEETKHKMKYRRPGYTHSDETRKKISEAQIGEKNHMYGVKHTQENKNKISKAQIGKFKGEENSGFKGWYITPWGEFPSLPLAEEAGPDTITRNGIRGYCRNNTKKVNNSNVAMSNYLTEEDFGKTFKELGFDFRPK